MRLPNWLGDMVMASAFINALKEVYPNAEVSVIAKKGIHSLLKFFPDIKQSFIFSKDLHPGLKGAYRFGKSLAQTDQFDLFFCLPNSFSSAVMAFASGAKMTIGYKNEMRTLLLKKTYPQPKGLHRVDDYIRLLELYSGKSVQHPRVALQASAAKISGRIVMNCNSEAISRRLPVEKAREIITHLLKYTSASIELVGGPSEVDYINSIYNGLDFSADRLMNTAGKTNLPQLIETLAGANLMLSTDSGPAHLANALGIPTIVLFGAGNELSTAPYNPENRTVLRVPGLACAPCVRNTCQYGAPKCLNLFAVSEITAAVQLYLKR